MAEKAEKFSWNSIYRRRTKLAREVSEKHGLSHFKLTAGVKEPFRAYELTGGLLAEQPMWRVPFFVIAQHMKQYVKRADSHWHVIDHAWWLIADDRSGEPWGFVTEPYMNAVDAKTMAEELSQQHEDWEVVTEVWPTEKSAWNPGSTVPIVTVGSVGMIHPFLKHGVRAALDEMQWRL